MQILEKLKKIEKEIERRKVYNKIFSYNTGKFLNIIPYAVNLFATAIPLI